VAIFDEISRGGGRVEHGNRIDADDQGFERVVDRARVRCACMGGPAGRSRSVPVMRDEAIARAWAAEIAYRIASYDGLTAALRYIVVACAANANTNVVVSMPLRALTT
jgi:hypothetical protein